MHEICTSVRHDGRKSEKTIEKVKILAKLKMKAEEKVNRIKKIGHYRRITEVNLLRGSSCRGNVCLEVMAKQINPRPIFRTG